MDKTEMIPTYMLLSLQHQNSQIKEITKMKYYR